MRLNKSQIRNLGQHYSVIAIEKQLLNKQRKTKKEKDREKFESNLQYHNHKVNLIYENPRLIGIKDNFFHADTEYKLFNEKGIGDGAVDALIETKDCLYLIEYKTHHSRHQKTSARKQLIKAQNLHNFKTDRTLTKLLYVHDNFKTDILTPEGFRPYNYTPIK